MTTPIHIPTYYIYTYIHTYTYTYILGACTYIKTKFKIKLINKAKEPITRCYA